MLRSSFIFCTLCLLLSLGSPSRVLSRATKPPTVVATLRSRIQKDYDVMGTIICFQPGDSLNCAPPWFFASDYTSFSNDVQTRPGSSGWCYMDNTYLTNEYSYFWGWSSANITDMLTNVSTAAAAYATHTCQYTSSCNSTYSGDPQRMFDTFLGYVNSTFVASIQNVLKANPLETFCPPMRSQSALAFLTSSVDLGNEYFGLHNAILVPGVFNTSDNSSLLQEVRTEMQPVQSVSASILESVLLYMAFYSNAPKQTQTADGGDTQLYPGCSKRQYASHGCKDIVPSREWDLNGRIVPMAQRKTMALAHVNRRSLLPRGPFEADLDPRGSCANANSIQNNIHAIQVARGVADVAQQSVSAYGLALSAGTAAEFAPVLLTTPVGLTLFAGAVLLGTAWWVMDTTVSLCNIFPSCTFIPQGLRDTVQDVHDYTDFNDVLSNVAKGSYLSAAIGGAEVATGINVDKALAAAQNYQQQAKACCATNCGGAACSQASDFCGKSWVNVNCAD